MEPFPTKKLLHFDVLYDGNMKLAQELVRICHDSHFFTATEYPGQEEFYEEYLGKYDEFLSVLEHAEEERSRQVDWNFLETLRTALYELAAERVLSLYVFLVTFRIIFEYIDYVKGVRHSRPTLLFNLPLQIIKEKLVSYTNDVGKIHTVPFCSRTGAFGVNTFLYMFFNEVYPIGASTEVYPVHGGRYKGSLEQTLTHDIIHHSGYYRVAKQKEAMEHLRVIYYQILQDQNESNDRTSEDRTKAFIYYLFLYIHELMILPTCGEGFKIKEIEKLLGNPSTAPDLLPFFTGSMLYSPEVYGYDLEKNPGSAGVYVSEVIRDIRTDLCARYGELF